MHSKDNFEINMGAITSNNYVLNVQESSTSNWKDLPKSIMSSVEKTMETLVQMVRGTSPVMHTPPRERKNSITLSNIDAKLDKIKSEGHLNQDDPTSNISRSTFNIHAATM